MCSSQQLNLIAIRLHPQDGRISMAGINSKNVKTIAAAIHDVTEG